MSQGVLIRNNTVSKMNERMKKLVVKLMNKTIEK